MLDNRGRQEVQARTVDRDEGGMRLDRWFRTHFPDLSFGHLQKLLRSGQVRVDGGRAKTNTRLESGQTIRIPPLSFGTDAATESGGHATRSAASGRDPGNGPNTRARQSARRTDVVADELRAMTLFEDDVVLVLNKPPGLAVQGGSGLTKHVDQMLETLRDAKDRKPRLVHRLDRETAGVLVIAKTRSAAAALAAAFRSRSARKIYWSLVAGVPKPPQGRISTWLAKDAEAGEGMKIARHGDEEASHAVSLYSVVDQAGQSLAWLTMRPLTGRTHQLRAHAAHIGHPIVGDPLYFDRKDWTLPGGIQNRLHLHARRIVLPHPDGGTIDVTAPLPPHMIQSWNLLGFDVEAERGDEEEEA